ncbi:MAG: TonB-dependent receptor [Pyrinomonadaceae bacterium]|nr:TonB-dependent receptor [Pyrinomonadaceae bacterium]
MNLKNNFNKTLIKLLVVVNFMVLLCISSFAQGTSSVRGTVTDAQGKTVVGATVTIKSETKSFTRTQTSSDDGQFVFAAIPPDTYTITIEAKGFKKSVVPSYVAAVDSAQNLDVLLEIGQVSETVTITTENEAPLNTSNATLGNTINKKQIIDLPLSARNTAGLLSLQTGVTPDNGTGNGGAVNGGRSDQANVTLDGVDVNEQQGGRAFYSVLRVTPEELQEFRVTTTNADANIGRSSGAQISLVTRSGSNEFHGSGYYYMRPATKFQANDFFSNASNTPIASQQRKNWGGSFGGPIKKDKLFFFGAYERFQEATESPVTTEVPLATLGQGIVRYKTASGASDAGCPSGTPTGVNCLTVAEINAAYTAANGMTPGVNQTALNFLASAANKYKANDTSVGDGLNTSGYRFNAKTPIKNNSVTFRLDGKLTSSQDVFFRFKSQYDNQTFAARLPDTPAPSNWTHPWGIAAGHTWTLNSNIVNKATYGFTRDAFTNGGDSNQNFVTFRFIFQPYNFSRELSRVTPVHNLADDMTWVKGSHTFSFGGNVRLISNKRSSYGASFDNASMNPSYYDGSGDVVTISEVTGNPIFGDVSGAVTTDLRDALTAVIGRFSQYGANLQYDANGKLLPSGQAAFRNFKTEEYEFYGQDSWRFRNNLTFNYGLRWSTSTPVYEANGLQVSPTESLSTFFDKRVAGAFNGQPYNGLITVDKSGPVNGKKGYYDQDWNNFAPAISAAWSPNFKSGWLKTLFGSDGKSSIRGGFRMTYDRIGSALAVAFDGGSTLGFSSSSSTGPNTFNMTTNLGPLFSGLTTNVRGFGGLITPSTLTFPLQTPPLEAELIEQSLDDKLTTPYNYSFNLSYGRELGKGITMEASYVGRIGRNLLISRDVTHFNNLRDPASGQDFYGFMKTLLGWRAGNVPITAVPNLAWANKFIPGLATTLTICGQSVNLTPTQAAYRRVARATANNSPTGACIGGRNTQDYTFVQTLWDDGLGFGNNIFEHPQYATFDVYSTLGTSDYHAFQWNLRKRFSQGLGFDFNYTLSHSLDTASGNEASGSIRSGAVFILNPLDLNENRGDSDFDARQMINANFIYEIPFGKGKRFFNGIGKVGNHILGGWQLTGIYRWNTGFAAGTPFDDGRWATNWNVQSNLVAIKDIQSSPTKSGTPNLFSNPLAALNSYRNAIPGEAGDRNILRDQSYVVFDAGLFKSVNINENHKVTFRLEVFNLTNTQRLTGVSGFGVGIDPYLATTAPTSFGKLTAIQGAPRVVQFAFRYDF